MEKNDKITELKNNLDITFDVTKKIEIIKQLISLEDKKVVAAIRPHLTDTNQEVRYHVIIAFDKYSARNAFNELFNIFTTATESEKNKALILQVLAKNKYKKIIDWIETTVCDLVAEIKINETVPDELCQKIMKTALVRNIIESCGLIGKSTFVTPLVKMIQIGEIREDAKKALLNFEVQALEEIWVLRKNTDQAIRLVVYSMVEEAKNEDFLSELINFLDECDPSDFEHILNNIAKYEWNTVAKLVNKIKTAHENYKMKLLQTIKNICSKVTFDEAKSKELAQYIVDWLNSKTAALTSEELEFFVAIFTHIKIPFPKYIGRLLDNDIAREKTKQLIKHTLSKDEFRETMLVGLMDATPRIKKEYFEDMLIIISETYQSTSDQNILKTVIKKLYSDSKKARSFAKETLSKIGSKSIPVLIEHLNMPDVPKEVKVGIIKLLGELGDASVAQQINKKIAEENKDEDVCTAYIETLRSLKDNSSVPVLGTLLVHPRWVKVRRKSSEALGEFDNNSVIKFLLQGLQDADETVIQNSAISIKKYKTPEIAEALRKCYDSTDHAPKTKAIVLDAMHELRGVYESKLADPNQETRKEAIETLGRLKLKESLGVLDKRIEAKEEPILGLRQSIRESINSIKGISFTPEPIDIMRCAISSNRTCNIKPGQNRNEVFVIASCDEEFSEEREQLSAAISDNGLTPEFAEENIKDLGLDAYCQKICSKIIGARFCIALLNSPRYKNDKFLKWLSNIEAEKTISLPVLTRLKNFLDEIRFPSPNVYYEYGLIQMVQTRCLPILKKDQEKDFAFDVRNIDSVFYYKKDLEEKAEDDPERTKFRKNMKNLIKEYREITKRAEEQE